MKKALAAVLAGLLVAALGACTQLSLGSAPMNARFDGAETTTIASGGVLVNSAGMTLYTYDKDVAGSGKSTCNGPCAVNWPPLSAATSTTSSSSAASDWSIVVRDDGSRQWAFQGKPVYLWTKDAKPGDKTGDGVNNAWRVIRRM